jgi:hypothetical protein
MLTVVVVFADADFLVNKRDGAHGVRFGYCVYSVHLTC